MPVDAAILAGALFAAPISSLAPPGLTELESHADDMTIDTERRELELRGHVEVDAAPFHLRSESLRLRRTVRGIAIDGRGELAFCPCLGTPLTLSFDDALVGPPSDLILRQPRLEIYGVPVLWLPYFWLRAPDRAGLLPPEISYRGKDGIFFGSGVHLPWASRDRDLGFDLRGGGYVKGGFAVDGDLRTPSSRTKVRFDWLNHAGGGLSVDARGAEIDEGRGVAWDVNTLRGARAVASTLSLSEASLPLDRSRGEAFVREGPFTFSTSAVVLSRRGSEGLDSHAGGPMALASAGGNLGSIGSYDLSARGGAVRSAERSTTSFAQTEGHLGVSHPLGAFEVSLDGRGELAAADDGERSARFGTARGQAQVALPLVRGYSSADPSDPWRHLLEPRLSGVALLESTSGNPNANDPSFGRGIVPFYISGLGEGTRRVLVPEASLFNALGRWGARDGAELEIAGGYALGDVRAPIARARLAASGDLLGASAESGARLDGDRGVAVSSRVRLGKEFGLRLEGRASGRAGIDPTLARALAPSMREAASAYFAASGFSAGGSLAIPWAHFITTRGGADVDLTTGSLLGTSGSIDLRDACGCVTLRLFGSHRIGRDGVDVWLALDLGDLAHKN